MFSMLLHLHLHLHQPAPTCTQPESNTKGNDHQTTMTKATLPLIALLSYLIGLYLSPRLLQTNYLSQLLTPILSSSDSSGDNHGNPKPVELPPLPPSLSPGNTAKTKVNESNKNNDATETRHTEEPVYNYTAAYHSLLHVHPESTTTTNNQDPFQNIQFVIHRNGEADPCSIQKPHVNPSTVFIQSSQLFNKAYEHYDKYDFDALFTHVLGVGTSSPPKVYEKGSSPSNHGLLEENGSGCFPTWKSGRHYLDSHTFTTEQLDANPQEEDVNREEEHKDKYWISSFLKFCDMGHDRTPIQLDHGRLVRIPTIKSLPCHFHTREGLRVDSLTMLAELATKVQQTVTNQAHQVHSDECTANQAEEGTCTTTNPDQPKELHLYAVPAGRVFLFAPKYIGEIFELPHVSSHDNLPVSLQVLSLSPRVFDIYNFFSREESARIVDKALKETSETHRMKRSSTGASGYNVNSQRTSENGFDTHGKEAQEVKKRCMNVLGFDVYEEGLTDGLQVLRYNKTTAYVPHLDWIDDYQKQQEHNYDSEGVGSNRFATILLYMSDLEEGDGGETVFTQGWPSELAEEERVPFDTALSQLRESGDVEGLLSHGSWEESMVARCRSRLAVRPHSSRAVLFYSQEPDGTPDKNSLHGGCPVIKNEKWAGKILLVTVSL